MIYLESTKCQTDESMKYSSSFYNNFKHEDPNSQKIFENNFCQTDEIDEDTYKNMQADFDNERKKLKL